MPTEREVTNHLQFAGTSLDTWQLPAFALPERCSVVLGHMINENQDFEQVKHSQTDHNTQLLVTLTHFLRVLVASSLQR